MYRALYLGRSHIAMHFIREKNDDGGGADCSSFFSHIEIAMILLRRFNVAGFSGIITSPVEARFSFSSDIAALLVM